MFSSAEISVVETLGSPKRLNRSSVTSRMRSAVLRGAFFAMDQSLPCVVRDAGPVPVCRRTGGGCCAMALPRACRIRCACALGQTRGEMLRCGRGGAQAHGDGACNEQKK